MATETHYVMTVSVKKVTKYVTENQHVVRGGSPEIVITRDVEDGESFIIRADTEEQLARKLHNRAQMLLAEQGKG